MGIAIIFELRSAKSDKSILGCRKRGCEETTLCRDIIIKKWPRWVTRQHKWYGNEIVPKRAKHTAARTRCRGRKREKLRCSRNNMAYKMQGNQSISESRSIDRSIDRSRGRYVRYNNRQSIGSHCFRLCWRLFNGGSEKLAFESVPIESSRRRIIERGIPLRDFSIVRGERRDSHSYNGWMSRKRCNCSDRTVLAVST